MAALLVAWPFCAGAQAISTTQIADTLTDSSGNPLSGSLRLTWPNFTSGAGDFIPAGSQTYELVSGAMNIQLAPTVNGSPSVCYSVRFLDSHGGPGFTQIWSVPVANYVLRLANIEVASCPLSSSVKRRRRKPNTGTH